VTSATLLLLKAFYRAFDVKMGQHKDQYYWVLCCYQGLTGWIAMGITVCRWSGLVN